MIRNFFNQTIKILKPERTRTVDGGYDTVYTESDSTSGRKVKVSGAERIAGDKIDNFYREFIYLSKYSNTGSGEIELKEADKLSLNGEIYNIKTIIIAPDYLKSIEPFLKVEVELDKSGS